MQSTICFFSEMKMPVEILTVISRRGKKNTNQNNELNPGVSEPIQKGKLQPLLEVITWDGCSCANQLLIISIPFLRTPAQTPD